MKEVNIKVSNISNKQWANLLLELNLVKSSWKRFGPNLSIKARNFDKIIKWGTKIHGEDTRDIDFTFRRNTRKRQIKEIIATYREFEDPMKDGFYLNDGRGTWQGVICE